MVPTDSHRRKQTKVLSAAVIILGALALTTLVSSRPDENQHQLGTLERRLEDPITVGIRFLPQTTLNAAFDSATFSIEGKLVEALGKDEQVTGEQQRLKCIN